MNSSLLSLYQHLPQSLRYLSRRAVGMMPIQWRMGRGFYRQLEWLERSQWRSRDELAVYQEERLRDMIRHAYENVPYYRELFDRLHLKPADIGCVHDLEELPILNRQTVIERAPELWARNIPEKMTQTVSTSGTTGRTVRIRALSANEFLYGGPYEWRFFRLGGYQPGDRCAAFRAHLISKKDRICEFNPVQNKVFFSVFHLRSDTARSYAEALARWSPVYVTGYVSVLADLATLLREKGVECPIQPRAIFTIGALVTAVQRQRIENYFGCHLFDWYGMEERAVVAHECEHHSHHHQIMEYGIVEFLEAPGVDRALGRRVVATSLMNPAMPLIRYDTEDLALPVEAPCPCGRGFPLMKIIGGRNRTTLVDAHGESMIVISGVFDQLGARLRAHQYVQERDGLVTLRIVPEPQFTAQDRRNLEQRLAGAFGDRIHFEVECVERLERTPGGKTPLVISNLSPAPSSPAGLSDDESRARRHWSQIARHWDQLGSPLRPSAADIVFYAMALESHASDRACLRALILGVTPELYCLPWPAGAHVLAVDHTRGMIDALWPGPRLHALHADWTTLPLADASRDMVLCDGGLHLLSWPEGQRRLVKSLRRVIVPGGLCIFRLYTPPTHREPPEAVLRDLFAGAIPSLNVLKLRLGMAMQRNAAEGVVLKSVWHAIHELDPDRERLAARLGWPLEHLLAIDSYRDCEGRYCFVDLDQVRELFCRFPGGFGLEAVRTPDYPMGGQCPVVVLRRVAESGGSLPS